MFIFAQLDGLQAILMFLGLAIITAVLLRRSYRRLGDRNKNQPLIEKAPRFAPHEPSGPYEHGKVLPPVEKARWEGEMCDIARETSARLDSKMNALAELIRQADLAAARLEAANREAAAGPSEK